MEWIQNPNQYKSIEDAILGMSGQTELELLSPDTVPPDCVDGIPEAARAIQFAIENKIPVKIVGDYDVDGITSTAILTKLLNYYGVEPSTYIPKRFTDGYGVSEKILAGVKNTLIITVDNGIAAGDVLDKAVEEGRNGVVVLDHHLPDGREPKNAIAVVDPYLHPDLNEFTEYCGAGLAHICQIYPAIFRTSDPKTAKILSLFGCFSSFNSLHSVQNLHEISVCGHKIHILQIKLPQLR